MSSVAQLLLLLPVVAAQRSVDIEAHRLRHYELLHGESAVHALHYGSGALRALAVGEHHTRVVSNSHVPRARFGFTAYGRSFDLVLQRNDALVSHNFKHVVSWVESNGTLTHTSYSRKDIDHCYYHGHLADEPSSLVAVHTCGTGVEASIRTQIGEHYVLLPAVATSGVDCSNVSAHKPDIAQLPHHVLFRTSDHGLNAAPTHQCELGPTWKHESEPGLATLNEATPVTGFSPTNGCTCKRAWVYGKELFSKGGCQYTNNLGLAHGMAHTHAGNTTQNADHVPQDHQPWCFTEAECGFGGGSSWIHCQETNTLDARRKLQNPTYPSSPPAASTVPITHFVELAMVNDDTFYASHAGSGAFDGALSSFDLAGDGGARTRSGQLSDTNTVETRTAHELCLERDLQIVNALAQQYQSMQSGISVSLSHVRTFTSTASMGALGGATDISEYLQRLADWRQNVQMSVLGAGTGSTEDFSSDNTALMTATDQISDTGSSSVAGLAYVGTMCHNKMSASVNEDKSGTTWQWTAETVTHEMGHNFGSHHDGSATAANCPSAGHVMATSGCGNCPRNAGAPSSDMSVSVAGLSTWSACSTTFTAATLQGLGGLPTNCLSNSPAVLSPTCGDSIVSDGEVCDAGPTGSAHCTSTCTLVAGVQCAHGDCCDTETGQFKAAGQLCRAAMHQCDLPDYCPGGVATCPGDLFHPDGSPCSEGGVGALCVSGSCKGLDSQCASAFSGYTGTWVANAAAQGGPICTQGSGGCGELKCTMTTWPQNAICIGMDSAIPGWTLPAVTVSSGTPCTHADGTIGLCNSNSQCGPMPTTTGAPLPSPSPPGLPPPPPPPPPPPQPVPCEGTWSPFTTCSVPCDGGTQSRTFTVTTPAANGADACPTSQTQTCNIEACQPGPVISISCVGAFGAAVCSSTCGGGNLIATYHITQHSNGTGASCPHANGDTQVGATCNIAACGGTPVADGSTCNPAVETDCLNGVCGETLAGEMHCFCNSGYEGLDCSIPVGCQVDCAAEQNRQDCIQPDVCGPCLLGWGERDGQCTMAPAIDPNDISIQDPPHIIKGLSNRRMLDANGETKRRILQSVSSTPTGGANPGFAMDGDPYTHWTVDLPIPWDASTLRTNKPQLNVVFDHPTRTTHYTIVSGNSHPSQDPKSWEIYCNRTEDPSGDWLLVDTKANEMWTERHQPRLFQMTPAGNIYPLCSEITFLILEIQDAVFQGGASADQTTPGTTVITDQNQQQSFTPQLQLAEVALLYDASVLNPAFTTNSVSIEDGISMEKFVTWNVIIGSIGICSTLLAFATCMHQRKQTSATLALITDLGFSVDEMPSAAEVALLKRGRVSTDIEEAFMQHDSDSSGGIDKHELHALLRAYGFALSQDYIDSLWATFDEDDSNALEVEEFSALMKLIQAKAERIDRAMVKPVVDCAPDVPVARKGRLSVTVVSAEGLPQMDFIGRNHPYVICDVNGYTSKTSVCSGGSSSNPSWGRGGAGERLSFLCDRVPTAVQIKVLDDDFHLTQLFSGGKTLASLKSKIQTKIGTANDPIGCAYLDLTTWDPGIRFDTTLLLHSDRQQQQQQQRSSSRSMAEQDSTYLSVGNVRISLRWEPAKTRNRTPERKSIDDFNYGRYGQRAAEATTHLRQMVRVSNALRSPTRNPPSLPTAAVSLPTSRALPALQEAGAVPSSSLRALPTLQSPAALTASSARALPTLPADSRP